MYTVKFYISPNDGIWTDRFELRGDDFTEMEQRFEQEVREREKWTKDNLDTALMLGWSGKDLLCYFMKLDMRDDTGRVLRTWTNEDAVRENVLKWKSVMKKRKRINLALEVVGKLFLIFVCLGITTLIVGSIRSCQENFIKEQRDKEFATYYQYNPITSTTTSRSDAEMKGADDEGNTVTVPKWTNKGGDWKACRKQFESDIKAIYSQKCYEWSPQKVECKIDNDTLWLFAFKYKDIFNVSLARKDSMLLRQFKDCRFAEVRVSKCDAGGVRYYQIYTDPSVKHTFPKTKEQKKSWKTNAKPNPVSETEAAIEDAVHEAVMNAEY